MVFIIILLLLKNTPDNYDICIQTPVKTHYFHIYTKVFPIEYILRNVFIISISPEENAL